jgi:hypothetical protein
VQDDCDDLLECPAEEVMVPPSRPEVDQTVPDRADGGIKQEALDRPGDHAACVRGSAEQRHRQRLEGMDGKCRGDPALGLVQQLPRKMPDPAFGGNYEKHFVQPRTRQDVFQGDRCALQTVSE